MKSMGKSLPFIILVVGVVGSLGLSALREEPPSTSSEPLAPLVSVAPVEQCEDGFKISVDGQVIPYREVSLAARVAGQIVMKSPQALAGNYVREGALLFEIDPSDYELEAQRLRETVKLASPSPSSTCTWHQVSMVYRPRSKSEPWTRISISPWSQPIPRCIRWS